MERRETTRTETDTPGRNANSLTHCAKRPAALCHEASHLVPRGRSTVPQGQFHCVTRPAALCHKASSTVPRGQFHCFVIPIFPFKKPLWSSSHIMLCSSRPVCDMVDMPRSMGSTLQLKCLLVPVITSVGSVPTAHRFWSLSDPSSSQGFGHLPILRPPASSSRG